MARSTTAIYKGSLNLNKVTGIRHDKGQRAISIQDVLKKEAKFPEPHRQKKTKENITSDGFKK
jgi:hypothetical protein